MTVNFVQPEDGGLGVSSAVLIISDPRRDGRKREKGTQSMVMAARAGGPFEPCVFCTATGYNAAPPARPGRR